jgi:hypothetical protein
MRSHGIAQIFSGTIQELVARHGWVTVVLLFVPVQTVGLKTTVCSFLGARKSYR